MFEIPETVETHALSGATIINLGFMSPKAAAKFEAALHGKTMMNFIVVCAVCPGGPYVSISTTYETSPVEILAFALNVMADA